MDDKDKERTIPTSIIYHVVNDKVQIWLRGGGVCHGEVVTAAKKDGRTISLGFDENAMLICIEIDGDMLHHDLVPFAMRAYPAAGNL